MKQLLTKISQLDRSDEGRGLLGPRINDAFEWMRVTERGISRRAVGNQHTAGLS